MKLINTAINALLIIIILPVLIHAQPVDSVKSNKAGSDYIEKMDRYLILKISMNDDIKGFSENNTVKYELLPNDKTALKLSANYSWLSLSYSTAPAFISGNKDDTLKGTTKSTSFSLNFSFNHWMQSLAYNRVKGYYLNNTADFRPGWIKGVDPYIQFPDLVYTSYSGQTAYKFNKNFSFNALGSQTERQLKSAGTFIPALIYNYYIIDDKTKLTGQNSSQKSNNLEVLLAAGYFYTLIIKKNFYVSAGVSPAAGIITNKVFVRQPAGNSTLHFTNAIFRLDAAGALGYNAERFFAGLQLLASAEAYSENNGSNVIGNDHSTYQLFIGYRFNAPRLLQNALDKADEKSAHLLK